MKSITYKIVIDSISSIHGQYPGNVDVDFHREDEAGERDGFESRRIALTSAVINDDGSVNDAEVEAQVVSQIGETETHEVEGDEE